LEIIPAIDLKGGKCVRLRQGEFTQVETYTEDPVKYAQRWEQEGAKRLHIVDLDGARAGMPQNLDAVRQIMRRISIPVQLGGGIRTAEVVERMLRIGIDRVILGTSAAQDQVMTQGALMQFGDKIIIGVDAKDGFVAVQGWQERTGESAVTFAKRMAAMGAKRIIFTDIARDGMMSGPNFAAVQEITAAVAIPVIASGGIGSAADVRSLAALGIMNLEGAIVGKALYSGALTVRDSIAAAV
jgi:phosphoribosylformimino-5-aminoimidazole carboxamide ribotide isomerase